MYIFAYTHMCIYTHRHSCMSKNAKKSLNLFDLDGGIGKFDIQILPQPH